MRKFYKKDGAVYEFEQDGSQDYLISDQHIPMTAEEVDRHINPQEYYSEEKKREVYLASFKPLTKRQFNLFMFDIGLRDQVDVLLDANPRARVEFDSTDKIERNNPTVEGLITQLGWSDQEVEQMWEQALLL